MTIACSAAVSMAALAPAAPSNVAANAIKNRRMGRTNRIAKGSFNALPEALLVDDDSRVAVAEGDHPRQRRIGLPYIVEGADAHPIEPLAVSVDWRNGKFAGG